MTNNKRNHGTVHNNGLVIYFIGGVYDEMSEWTVFTQRCNGSSGG